MDRTPGRRHGQHVASTLGQPAVELLQRGRLPRAGGAAQTDRPVAGGQHLVHRVLLLGPQPIGRQEGVIAAQPIEGADAPIDGGDHLPLAVETLARRDLMPDPEDRARGLLQPQHALGVCQRNPPAALSQRFGEDLVILDDRPPFEEMLLGVPQCGGGRLEGEALPFPRGLERLLPELSQGLRLLGREPGALALLDLGGGDRRSACPVGIPGRGWPLRCRSGGGPSAR